MKSKRYILRFVRAAVLVALAFGFAPTVSTSPQGAPVSPLARELGERLEIRPDQALRLSEDLVSWCVAARVQPSLLLGLVEVESEFKSNAISEAGAVGLMQIMPSTAVWILRNDLGLGAIPESQLVTMLKKPHFNLFLGVLYLKRLQELYGGDTFLVLGAYRMGPARFSRALRNFKAVQDGIERAAYFSSTSAYARKVFRAKRRIDGRLRRLTRV